ncbi:hypothetical protein P5G50_02320 [Leifsonia sp. F6_8S_P_1B]|uniref:Uncharacterized protein n=1 Tax=Leifsonia williamsii TaxID=3035919 RepID=A0ABT8K8Y6_9MICO|nr:hypothetical protein [Leifsonia williamsii]MDN4613276.1 hypothetical protein [Leifsonia williamsii]
MKAKGSRVAAMTAGVCVLGGLLTGFTPNDSDAVNAADALAAIQAVAPEGVSDVVRGATADGVAAEATVEGTPLAVPFEAVDGISVGEVSIGLPFADNASAATASPVEGVVAFDNNNGTTTVPVIHDDGTVQIHTVVDSASAPNRYDYPIELPEGASLVKTPEGVVAVVGEEGTPLAVFGEAWAKDAKGEPVPTHYEVTGSTLTQVVETDEHTAYPVVADPSTGVYSYNCVLQNGSSYFLAHGALLSTCKGSRLQKYLDGRNVQTIPLTGYGQPANPKAFGTPECYFSLAWAGISIYGPGRLVKFLSGAFGYVIPQFLPTNLTACRG